MAKESVWLTDYNTTFNHHFQFSIGERVKLRAGNLEGVVQNALFEADGAYDITYHIETAEGNVFEALEDDLEKK